MLCPYNKCGSNKWGQMSIRAERGSVTEAVTRGKVVCKYYETKISAFMMIWDSDCSSLLKSSDLDWSRN